MYLREGIVFAAVASAGVFLLAWVCERERKKRVMAFCLNRNEVPIEQEHKDNYSAFDCSDVASLLGEIAKVYGVNRSLLRSTDRFKVELRQLSFSIADTKYEMICSLYRKKKSAAGKSLDDGYPETVGEFVNRILDT